MKLVDELLFGVYPYVCLAVFLLGSYLRYEGDPYGWRSRSSQFLQPAGVVWGSNLFHAGVLLLFAGHFVGLLTPVELYTRAGLSVRSHQILAIVTGGLFGTACLAGLLLLGWRRLFDPRIRRTGTPGDVFVLALLLVQLLLGLATLPVSYGHLSGEHMVALSLWSQRIVTFRGGTGLLEGVPWVYKAHLVLGLTVFLVLPFTRLVHIWSAPFGYLRRPWQVVRVRGRAADEEPPR